MELIEIKGLFEMDAGAPSPIILSNDNELLVSFYGNKDSDIGEPHQRNTVYDTGIFILKFKSFLKYSFGLPSNETIQGHPYFKLGLSSYSERSHPYYNPEKWKEYKHYILTFHDNMFECVAEGFEVSEENTSIYHQVGIMLNELSQKDF